MLMNDAFSLVHFGNLVGLIFYLLVAYTTVWLNCEVPQFQGGTNIDYFPNLHVIYVRKVRFVTAEIIKPFQGSEEQWR